MTQDYFVIEYIRDGVHWHERRYYKWSNSEDQIPPVPRIGERVGWKKKQNSKGYTSGIVTDVLHVPCDKLIRVIVTTKKKKPKKERTTC